MFSFSENKENKIESLNNNEKEKNQVNKKHLKTSSNQEQQNPSEYKENLKAKDSPSKVLRRSARTPKTICISDKDYNCLAKRSFHSQKADGDVRELLYLGEVSSNNHKEEKLGIVQRIKKSNKILNSLRISRNKNERKKLTKKSEKLNRLETKLKKIQKNNRITRRSKYEKELEDFSENKNKYNTGVIVQNYEIILIKKSALSSKFQNTSFKKKIPYLPQNEPIVNSYHKYEKYFNKTSERYLSKQEE